MYSDTRKHWKNDGFTHLFEWKRVDTRFDFWFPVRLGAMTKLVTCTAADKLLGIANGHRNC